MKHRYIFNFKANEVEDVCKKIAEYKPQYVALVNKYLIKQITIDNYIEQREFMYNYREEVLKLLKKIINDFHYFQDKAVIFLSGSYARNTIRVFSDLDLNIMYTNGSGKKYLKYEELFYYYISKIFDMSRDGVHSIVTAFNDKKNYDYVVKNLDDKPIKITLSDENVKINYEISGGYKKRLYLQYMNNKNYKVIFDNLMKQNLKIGLQEWSNNILFLNHKKCVDEYYKKYQKFLIKNVSEKYVEEEYEQIKNYPSQTYDLDNNIAIKKFVQTDELHFIYKIIVLMQVLRLKKTKMIYSNFKDILDHSDENLKHIVEGFYKYNYYIVKLYFLFAKYDIQYSIHQYHEIDFKKQRGLKSLLNRINRERNYINAECRKLLEGEIFK